MVNFAQGRLLTDFFSLLRPSGSAMLHSYLSTVPDDDESFLP